MLTSSNWLKIDEKLTDINGRVKDFLPENSKEDLSGTYKLTSHVKPYFTKLNQESFYPYIEVIFNITDNKHYHVPITLSAFGYSTYKGN